MTTVEGAEGSVGFGRVINGDLPVATHEVYRGDNVGLSDVLQRVVDDVDVLWGIDCNLVQL